jgi:hypothetical protein
MERMGEEPTLPLRSRVTKVELYDVGCISPVSASKKKPMEKESAFFTMNA